ncbi:MAG: ABC transporter ATP-binding protein [Planctomycetes bacterium]|nr:ABC transporter ATP-binding protein [Planctomycetota bacterium]
MDPIIETHDLCKRFGGKRAVDGMSLAVPKGAIFALLGDNGAGKTTTIRMLTGQLPADRGSAKILGQDCWAAAEKLRLKVGYVPERPRYYDWMTIAEIGWFAAGFHAAEFYTRYQQWLDKFKLDANARLDAISKGEYAKVGLALALAIDPEVLILDEPTSGLDLLVRQEFLGSMVGMAAEGRTILISSHQIGEVERVASHVAFIASGKLLLTATMDELRQRIIRLKLRYEAEPPDAAVFGSVLQTNGSGKHWQAVLQDPRLEALETLKRTDGIHDMEVSTLHLEEIYCALLARKV